MQSLRGTASKQLPKLPSAPLVNVRYYRSRWIKLIVGTATTAQQLIERLRKELYLEDLPTEYALFAPGEGTHPGHWLAGADNIRDPIIWCCGRPSTLHFTLDGGDDATFRHSLLVDLNSLPRDTLPELRARVLGARRTDSLFVLRFGDDFVNMGLPWNRQCVVEGAEISILPISVLLKRTLGQTLMDASGKGLPVRRGWLRKRKSSKMISREQARFAVLSHRCVVYFKVWCSCLFVVVVVFFSSLFLTA